MSAPLCVGVWFSAEEAAALRAAAAKSGRSLSELIHDRATVLDRIYSPLDPPAGGTS